MKKICLSLLFSFGFVLFSMANEPVRLTEPSGFDTEENLSLQDVPSEETIITSENKTLHPSDNILPSGDNIQAEQDICILEIETITIYEDEEYIYIEYEYLLIIFDC